MQQFHVTFFSLTLMFQHKEGSNNTCPGSGALCWSLHTPRVPTNLLRHSCSLCPGATQLHLVKRSLILQLVQQQSVLLSLKCVDQYMLHALRMSLTRMGLPRTLSPTVPNPIIRELPSRQASSEACWPPCCQHSRVLRFKSDCSKRMRSIRTVKIYRC